MIEHQGIVVDKSCHFFHQRFAGDFSKTSKVIMATALEKIGRHLECDICQERYKRPKVLDCLHNFCQKCLEEYYNSRFKDAPKIPCPKCRKETLLPQTCIQDLKTNFHLMGIVEEVSEQEKLDRSQENKCPKHQGDRKRFYCETCQELICSSCAVLDHCKPQHHYIDIGEASLKYKHSLIDMISDFRADIKQLEQSLAASSQVKQKLTTNVIKTVKAVQTTASKMRAEIRTQEKKLIDEIQRIQQDCYRMFNEHQKTVTTMLQGKQHSLAMAKDFINTTSENYFLSLYPAISEDLESLRSPHPPQIDPKLSYLRFSQGQRTDEINLGKLEVKADKWETCHEFGKAGIGWFFSQEKLSMLQGIAETQPGEIAVAEWSNKRVVICSNEGQHKENIPLQSPPRDITAIHNHDNQLVVVDDTKYVKVFDKKNKLAFQFPTVPQSEVDKPDVDLHSVAVRKDGTILVGDVKRMVWTEHRPTDGQLLNTIPVQTPPYFLAVDDYTDSIVVSGDDKQRVNVITSDGTTLSTILPTINGQLVNNCSALCCDHSNIYVAVYNEIGTGHIHHYDLDGVFLACLAQDLLLPQGITFTSGGQLALADWKSVKKYHKV
ncbi:E3 ubiquitin-protein ligase TRIM56-like [Acanthaster planci]|uniref:E3 ubiquitin-protein ligase TRIM56-like n=1 Tax=Acanthaster planci TaxID=133434 RepID=A0A8B7ZYR9_ACAPL|nr:E3 ubiquitin-protein ligase TRIM56-like [Acanthaster planci]